MSSNRTIVVGDLHGCLEEFDELLKLIEYRPGADDLGIVGDLVDRGPDPLGVVRRVRELGIWSTKGNHDDKHARYRGHRDRERAGGKKNPMRMNPERQREHDLLTDDDIAFLAGLPLIKRLREDLVVVHAGLEVGVPLEDQDPNVCTRLRYVGTNGHMVSLEPGNPNAPSGSEQWARRWTGNPGVIYGHHVLSTEGPTIFCNTYGIDTGCCFGGHLTAMIISDAGGEAWAFQMAAVKAKREYSLLRGAGAGGDRLE